MLQNKTFRSERKSRIANKTKHGSSRWTRFQNNKLFAFFLYMWLHYRRRKHRYRNTEQIILYQNATLRKMKRFEYYSLTYRELADILMTAIWKYQEEEQQVLSEGERYAAKYYLELAKGVKHFIDSTPGNYYMLHACDKAYHQ